METITVTLGDKSFTMDEAKAHEAFAAKKIINGRDTMFFNILPLKYHWAYEFYKEMKAAHWSPENLELKADLLAWQGLSEEQKKPLLTLLGYLIDYAESIGLESVYTLRDIVSAPELKLVFGRYVHEQNTIEDALVHILSGLQINPSDCTRIFSSAQQRMQLFSERYVTDISRDLNMNEVTNKQAFAQNIFVFSQCGEGVLGCGLFGSFFLSDLNEVLPGVRSILALLRQDAAFRNLVFKRLFVELCQENEDVRTETFEKSLESIMKEAVALEKDSIDFLKLPKASELKNYLESAAAMRMNSLGLNHSFSEGFSLPQLDAVFSPQSAQSAHATHQNSSQSTNDFDDDEL